MSHGKKSFHLNGADKPLKVKTAAFALFSAIIVSPAAVSCMLLLLLLLLLTSVRKHLHPQQCSSGEKKKNPAQVNSMPD